MSKYRIPTFYQYRYIYHFSTAPPAAALNTCYLNTKLGNYQQLEYKILLGRRRTKGIFKKCRETYKNNKKEDMRLFYNPSFCNWSPDYSF